MPTGPEALPPIAYLVPAVLAGGVIWMIVRGRSGLVIRIRDGRPQIERGTVAPAFLRDLEEICGRQGLERGVIRGVRHGRRVTLTFSRHIPDGCRQQIRNIWHFGG